VRPQAGSSWARQKKPIRHRANYTRPHGVRYYLAAYDVHADHLWMHQKKRKRWNEVLCFIKAIRNRYADKQKIYLVLDNFSAHKRKEIRDYCAENNIILVYTATYSSWMNRIECHFAPLKHFVINNSDYLSHDEIAFAMQDYLQWRNKNARDEELLKIQKSRRVL
jgi:transposase